MAPAAVTGQRSWASIPIAMAITKTITGSDSVERSTIAGPGDNPTSPQPIPNRSAPESNDRAAAAKPSAEPNQQATNDDHDVAPGHPWCRHSVAEKCSSKGCRNEASDKCRAPGTIRRLRIDKTSKNSTNAGNPAGEYHE